MKVYILTTGSYSDKENFAVFSSLEKAEEVIKNYPKESWNDDDIEEFEVDTYPKKREEYWFDFREDAHGNLNCINTRDDDDALRSKGSFSFYLREVKYLRITFKAKNIDIARKHASDLRAQILARLESLSKKMPKYSSSPIEYTFEEAGIS